MTKDLETLIRKNELAQERFKDLEEYFGSSRSILEDRKEFKKWLERGEQAIEKVDEMESKLEQQTINCNATTEEIAQSLKADIEAVKDYLPKCNSMEFPKTFDEFANDYGFTDDKEIYTNGSHLIPVFRVKQWLDHIEQQPTSDDCVSRQAVLDCLTATGLKKFDFILDAREKVNNLPPVTPTQCIAAFRFSKEDLIDICNERIEIECTHGTCKDCTNYVAGALDEEICLRGHELIHKDFYCADFKKRGNEDD